LWSKKRLVATPDDVVHKTMWAGLLHGCFGLPLPFRKVLDLCYEMWIMKWTSGVGLSAPQPFYAQMEGKRPLADLQKSGFQPQALQIQVGQRTACSFESRAITRMPVHSRGVWAGTNSLDALCNLPLRMKSKSEITGPDRRVPSF
jgi:hypothetical protein